MRTPSLALREELIDARENTQRQIDRLLARPYPPGEPGVGYDPESGIASIDNRPLIAKLSEILSEIDKAIAELGPENGQGI